MMLIQRDCQNRESYLIFLSQYNINKENRYVIEKNPHILMCLNRYLHVKQLGQGSFVYAIWSL